MKVEDIVVGSFAFLAMVYPVFIAFMIHLQENVDPSEDLKRIRMFYSVILGIASCDRVREVVPLIDKDLLSELGGEEGIKAICLRNRILTDGSSRLEERILKENGAIKVEVSLKVKEEGTVRRPITLILKARRKDGEVRIEEISYVQGG